MLQTLLYCTAVLGQLKPLNLELSFSGQLQQSRPGCWRVHACYAEIRLGSVLMHLLAGPCPCPPSVRGPEQVAEPMLLVCQGPFTLFHCRIFLSLLPHWASPFCARNSNVFANVLDTSVSLKDLGTNVIWHHTNNSMLQTLFFHSTLLLRPFQVAKFSFLLWQNPTIFDPIVLLVLSWWADT
jgi:hypothetical protein